MTIWVPLVGFLSSIGFSEILLRKRKLQSAIGRILIAQIAVGSFCFTLTRPQGMDLCVFFLFWIGAFICWFGVRSHLESSILLEMILLLNKNGRATEDEMTQEFASIYGEEQRKQELVRAGLLRLRDEKVELTRKGEWILAIASFLGAEAVSSDDRISPGTNYRDGSPGARSQGLTKKPDFSNHNWTMRSHAGVFFFFRYFFCWPLFSGYPNMSLPP